ncbi:MAG: hypothetical protein ABJ327_18965 [Litoreibacter sp.]
MADYTDYNDGIGGKGLLVAFLLIGAFIVGLIYLGGSTAVPPEGSVSTDPAAAIEAAPVADAVTPAAPAPVTE